MADGNYSLVYMLGDSRLSISVKQLVDEVMLKQLEQYAKEHSSATKVQLYSSKQSLERRRGAHRCTHLQAPA